MDLLKRASTHTLAIVALAVAWTAVPLVAQAQGSQAQGSQAQGSQAQGKDTPAQSPAPATVVSEQKLDQAAAALKDVTAVRESYLQKVEAAPPGEKQRLTEEANQALTKTVTDKGLSVEEYNNILQLAQNDQGLRQQLVKRLQPKAQ